MSTVYIIKILIGRVQLLFWYITFQQFLFKLKQILKCFLIQKIKFEQITPWITAGLRIIEVSQ